MPTFPTRADFERGCMPDGSPLRFPSRVLYQGWGAPIPGKSNVLKKALKQDPPPGCGSILTPEPDAFPHTGVPCPVPEQPDEELNARIDACKHALDEAAYNRILQNNRLLARVIDKGHEAQDFLDAHPELAFEDLVADRAIETAKPASPEPGDGRAKRDYDAEKAVAQVDAMDAGLKKAVAQAEEAARDVARASRPVSDDVNARDGSPASNGRAPVHVPESVNVRDEDSSSATDDKAPAVRLGSRQASRRTPKLETSRDDSPACDLTGREARATYRIPKKFRGDIYARCMALVDMARRAVPISNAAEEKARLLGHKLLDEGKATTLKNRFAENRAVAIIKNQLLYCDDEFRDLGFGGWMPFRFPDQWLTFMSTWRKLLAANGWISPKGPNHWRKFIEETPEVEGEELKLPRSLAPTDKYREISNLEEMFAKARDLAKRDREARRRFEQRFAMGP